MILNLYNRMQQISNNANIRETVSLRKTRDTDMNSEGEVLCDDPAKAEGTLPPHLVWV